MLQEILIGIAVVSLIIGIWAMLRGRGCDTDQEYYGYRDDEPKNDERKKGRLKMFGKNIMRVAV